MVLNTADIIHLKHTKSFHVPSLVHTLISFKIKVYHYKEKFIYTQLYAQIGLLRKTLAMNHIHERQYLEEAFGVYVFQNLTYLSTKPRSKRVDRDVCLLTSELYQLEKANNTISQSKRTILDHESDRGSATQTNS